MLLRACCVIRLSVSGAAAIAFDVHVEEGRVMHEAIDCGEGHGLVRKDLAPFAEGLIGGDQHRTPLVAASDQFEQRTGFGLILADVDDVVEERRGPY